MPSNDGPVRRCPGYHQESTESPTLPTSVPRRDARYDPNFARHRHQHGLKIRQGSLDLDDQERTFFFVPRQDVDRTAIAELVEGELGRDEPAGRRQLERDGFDDRRVAAVEEAIHGAAPPSRVDDEVDPESGAQATAVPQGDVLESAALDV